MRSCPDCDPINWWNVAHGALFIVGWVLIGRGFWAGIHGRRTSRREDTARFIVVMALLAVLWVSLQ